MCCAAIVSCVRVCDRVSLAPAGKTTFIRMLAGLLKADPGEDGKEPDLEGFSVRTLVFNLILGLIALCVSCVLCPV